ncbi:MAG TPA: VOC family protein [Thermomicrobiales bacterium]|nr:VOC family protein [Thermomicrobiales bacterium]
MRYGLHHVSIPVRPGQLEAGREFYGQALGLEEIPVPAEFEEGRVVWFSLGDRELHLFKEEDANQPRSERHLALEVDDLAAARARFAEHGIAVEETDPIHNRPRLYIRDPFGNKLEITELQGPYRE